MNKLLIQALHHVHSNYGFNDHEWSVECFIIYQKHSINLSYCGSFCSVISHSFATPDKCRHSGLLILLDVTFYAKIFLHCLLFLCYGITCSYYIEFLQPMKGKTIN